MTTEKDGETTIESLARRLFGIKPDEFRAVAWSFSYFFCILSAYYILRSVREAMAIVSGVQNIPWLFTGTFTAMLLATPVFGWLASHYPRRKFLPWVYYFFIANILFFFAAFTIAQKNDADLVWIGRSFFVWLSVFNLFVVSVFWSFMADIWSREQGRRLFGFITAGGSAGALIGPLISSVLVTRIGFQNLLPISASLLFFAVFCVFRLRARAKLEKIEIRESTVGSGKPLGGGALDGIRQVFTSNYLMTIAIVAVFASVLGTALYMYMAQLVSQTFPDTNRHAQVFALLDAATNGLSLLGQLFIVNRFIRKFGVGMTLSVLPVISIIGFAMLALSPTFAVIAVFQVLRRSVTFGMTKPTNDMLYSVVTPEEKYKAKNFIETALYRGGDLIGVWGVRLVSGLGLAGISLICIPIAGIWAYMTFWLGRKYKQRDLQLSQMIKAKEAAT